MDDPRADLDPYAEATGLLGRSGAMLSGSKTADPERRVVWNGNVLAGIWYGDISITEQADNLQALADRLGVTIRVLYEMDCRFDTEHEPRLSEAVETFEPVS